jgi:hypothetical protein
MSKEYVDGCEVENEGIIDGLTISNFGNRTYERVIFELDYVKSKDFGNPLFKIQGGGGKPSVDEFLQKAITERSPLIRVKGEHYKDSLINEVCVTDFEILGGK